MLEKKIPPLILVVIATLLIWGVSRWLPVVDSYAFERYIAAGLLAAFAVAIAVAGALAFRKLQTTVDPRTPEAASTLVVVGIYRFSRNPMYTGFVALLLAECVLLGSVWALLVVAAFGSYLKHFQIVPEERALMEKFGPRYRDYLNRVRRWL
ncbi:MAG: methyltransferase family protein [Pseudomonadota bacterium]